MPERLPHAFEGPSGIGTRCIPRRVVLCTVLALTACFPTRTLQQAELRTAYPTEFRLTQPTTLLVRPAVGADRSVEGVTRIRGVLASLATDTAVVTAARLTIDGREFALRADEAVYVPVAQGAIASAHQQRFSGKRTLVLVGGVAGTLLLAVVVMLAIMLGSDDS